MLLAFMVIASVAFWWWFRPVVVEEPWSVAYGLTLEYKTRRSWNGHQYYVGPAILRYKNGNLAAKGIVDGFEHESITFFSQDDHFLYWHEDGRKLLWHEWFFYISSEYIPRQMNGEPISTEDEWRRMAVEFEKAHPELRDDKKKTAVGAKRDP